MRDFRGLDRLVNSFFEKRAELEKEADPPGRGIHDPNPAVAYAHRNYGFVPQVPWSYLSGANTLEDYDRVRAGMAGSVSPDTPQMYDYNRRAGAVDNSMYVYDTNRKMPGFVMLGSYPLDSDTVARHEHGHFLDDMGRGFPHRLLHAGTPDDAVRAENAAWDMAGIGEDNPVRRAAMDTYNNAVERKKALDDGPQNDARRSVINNNFSIKQKAALERFKDTAAAEWRSPDGAIAEFGGDVPVLHGYDSARRLHSSNPFAARYMSLFNTVSDSMLENARNGRTAAGTER